MIVWLLDCLFVIYKKNERRKQLTAAVYCNPPGKSQKDCIWLATDNDLISLREKYERETKIGRIEKRTRLILGGVIL